MQPEEKQPIDRPFQYSLKLLLALFVVLAVLLSIFFVIADLPAIICLLAFSVVVPTFFVSGAIYGRGSQRAFCIGALLPTAIVLAVAAFVFVDIADHVYDYIISFPNLRKAQLAWKLRFASACGYAMAIVTGIVSVTVRRFLQG